MEENTTFDEVFDMFMSMITDYDFLKFTDNELYNELVMLLRKSMAKFRNFDGKADYDMEEFTKQLTDTEMHIIALGMLSAHISPRINNSTLLKQSVSMKDYQIYSQQAHLTALIDLKNTLDRDFHYYMNVYKIDKMIQENKQ